MGPGGTEVQLSRYRGDPLPMTTQLPYESPPGGGYPTAPPWATPTPSPAPQYGPEPHTRHGQLMVPYPELMRGVSAPTAPSWGPVVVWTFFFGIFGAISAARRADRAARSRNARYPYWVAFGITLVIGVVLSAIAVATAVPVYLNFRDHAVTKAVQSSMAGQPAGARGVTVTRATCTPLDAERNGTRTYTCSLVLSNGRTSTLKVVADTKSGKVRPARG